MKEQIGLYTVASRRHVLNLAGLAGVSFMLAACGKRVEAPLASTLEPVGIRREIGAWTRQDIEAFARAMMRESDINEIAYAGGVLLDNQRGNPSTSRISKIFSDEPIKVTTYSSLPSTRGAGVEIQAPMEAIVRESSLRYGVSLRSKNGGSPLKFSAPVALILEEVKLNHEMTKDASNFILKFFMAKEIYNAYAHDQVTAYIAKTTLYNMYEKPQSAGISNAVQASLMRSKFEEVPAVFMADMFAHFWMVPSYNIAVERGKFSQRELDGDDLRVFDIASKQFQKNGVLIRNSQGEYSWTQDADKFFNSWIELSKAFYRALGLNKN